MAIETFLLGFVCALLYLSLLLPILWLLHAQRYPRSERRVSSYGSSNGHASQYTESWMGDEQPPICQAPQWNQWNLYGLPGAFVDPPVPDQTCWAFAARPNNGGHHRDGTSAEWADEANEETPPPYQGQREQRGQNPARSHDPVTGYENLQDPHRDPNVVMGRGSVTVTAQEPENGAASNAAAQHSRSRATAQLSRGATHFAQTSRQQTQGQSDEWIVVQCRRRRRRRKHKSGSESESLPEDEPSGDAAKKQKPGGDDGDDDDCHRKGGTRRPLL